MFSVSWRVHDGELGGGGCSPVKGPGVSYLSRV